MNKPQLLNSLKNQGFSNKIINAFSKIRRENFIPKEYKEYVYEDEPLPIGQGQTISQPYTIAFMLNLLELEELNDINNLKISRSNISKIDEEQKRSEGSLESNRLKVKNKILKNKTKILEIGSGSGYVLALINEISKNSEIYGMERIKELADKSKQVLKNYKNIKIINADGSKGLKKQAPFDRILISAACSKVPEHLYPQLNDNGIIVASVQNSIFQIKKQKNKIKKKEFYGFVFVPLVEK